jgi:hypothetical protein
MAAAEAWRHDAREITNEHALLALARDAVTPWPAQPDAEARDRRLPVIERESLALGLLAQFGITPAGLVAETCRATGLIAPGSLSEWPSPPWREDTKLAANRRLAVTWEIAWGRDRHENHLSTLHQLLGIYSTRGGPARQILVDLGVADERAIERAARPFAEECERMHRRMLALALDNPALRKELSRIFPGSTRGLRWKRARLGRETEGAGDG